MHKNVFKLAAVGLALVMASPVWVAGQVRQLDDVVVTATRTPTLQDKLGGSAVTVLTQEDIQQQQAQRVSDVLRTVPGIQFSATGGLGSTSKLFMRGADTKNTLVMIDGVVVNDPADANRGADLANLTLDQVQRIEVVRGPMSVLYGSNATAGVIHIITQKGRGPLQGDVGVEAGSYDTSKVHGSLQAGSDWGDIALGLSYLDSGGYSLANADNRDIAHNGNTSEDDAWRNATVNSRWGLNLQPHLRLSGAVRYTEANMELDAWGPGYAGDAFAMDRATFTYEPAPQGSTKSEVDSERLFNNIKLDYSWGQKQQWHTQLAYNYSRQERDRLDNQGTANGDYLGQTHKWAWQTDWQWHPQWRLAMGLMHKEEEMESQVPTPVDAQAQTQSLWLQQQGHWGPWQLVAGGRYIHHEDAGEEFVWRLAPAYTIEATGTRLKASYATGFRAPSLYELFSAYGKEDLEAEESYSWEMGLEQPLGAHWQVALTWFRQEFEDRIAWDPERIIPGQAFPGGYNQLEGETTTQGLETLLQWRPDSPWQGQLDYTYTDTEDPDGARLVRRPLHRVHSQLAWKPQHWQLVLDGYWVSQRDAISSAKTEAGQKVTTLDDYVRFDCAAQYLFGQHWRWHARIENLLDEDYEEAWSYATPGFSVYTGLTATF